MLSATRPALAALPFGGPGDIGAECCPFSDESLKTKVVPLTSATENLLKIQGVTFEWKDGGRKDIGVIAQEVAKVYPQLTRTKDGLMQVDYDKLVAPLIESIRELNQRIAPGKSPSQVNSRVHDRCLPPFWSVVCTQHGLHMYESS